MPGADVRIPAVAGQFYPADAKTLTRDLAAYLAPVATEAEKFHDAIGCIVPHAGYMYSGHVAGAVYRRLPARSSYIILGPQSLWAGSAAGGDVARRLADTPRRGADRRGPGAQLARRLPPARGGRAGP